MTGSRAPAHIIPALASEHCSPRAHHAAYTVESCLHMHCVSSVIHYCENVPKIVPIFALTTTIEQGRANKGVMQQSHSGRARNVGTVSYAARTVHGSCLCKPPGSAAARPAELHQRGS